MSSNKVSYFSKLTHCFKGVQENVSSIKNTLCRNKKTTAAVIVVILAVIAYIAVGQRVAPGNSDFIATPIISGIIALAGIALFRIGSQNSVGGMKTSEAYSRML